MKLQMIWEIFIMNLIKHPCVIQLYEGIENRTNIYIILEVVYGRELLDKIVNHGILKDDANLDDIHAIFND